MPGILLMFKRALLQTRLRVFQCAEKRKDETISCHGPAPHHGGAFSLNEECPRRCMDRCTCIVPLQTCKQSTLRGVRSLWQFRTARVLCCIRAHACDCHVQWMQHNVPAVPALLQPTWCLHLSLASMAPSPHVSLFSSLSARAKTGRRGV